MKRRWRRSAAVIAALVTDAPLVIAGVVEDGVGVVAHPAAMTAASVIAPRRLYANFMGKTPDVAGKSWCWFGHRERSLGFDLHARPSGSHGVSRGSRRLT